MHTGWNDKIVTLEKMTWFHFRLMKHGFLFFLADHLQVGQLCTNPKSDRSLLSSLKVTQCSTSKTGDVPLMLSTDLTYDNRTIASTLKMQIQMVQHLRAQLNASDDPFEVVERKPKAEDTARKTRTKEFIEKVQAIIDETPQRPIRQIARDLGISHTTVNACVNACVKEDLKCRSYRRQTSQILTEKTKNLRLIKSVRLLTWTRWTTSFGHTSRTSLTWPLTKPKPAWLPPSAEYSLSSRRRLWKRHAPSSRSISRWWLRLNGATLNRCQLYYIIKLPELIFSIKVLK